MIRREDVSAAAQKLLDEAGVTAPPVPVERLVSLCDALLSREPLQGDISGMVFRDETRKVIGVNSLEVPARQRFTIAHEIGHLLLHEGRPVIVEKLVRINLRDKGSATTDREEREANQFAAELLMPAGMVEAAARELVGDQMLVSDRRFVADLAARFEVSAQAMEYRLVNLRLLSSLALGG
jgi:Zn-dependent peptidase ImmA (M78 family)